MFWHCRLSITSFSKMPPRQDTFALSQPYVTHTFKQRSLRYVKSVLLKLLGLLNSYWAPSLLCLPSSLPCRWWGVHPQHLAEEQRRTRHTLPGPWQRLHRQPSKTDETDQGCVHFFAVLPSSPSPGGHRPLPVVRQVLRWVQLKYKQSTVSLQETESDEKLCIRE